jgi:hypothetical protein
MKGTSMKAASKGKRHSLRLYRRMMDRLWRITALLGLLMAVWWMWEGTGIFAHIPEAADGWVFIAAIVTILFTVYALIGRSLAYVQARRDHIALVTPFLRLKIGYRRINRIYPVKFAALFKPGEMKWANRRFLEPFFSETALAVEMTSLPLSRGMLRLFLGPQTFLPTETGMVLLVKDWMALSNEIDSLRGQRVHQQAQRRKVITGS